MTPEAFQQQQANARIEARLRKVEEQQRALGSEIPRAFRGLLDSLEAAGGREERCVLAIEQIARLLGERPTGQADDWWRNGNNEGGDDQ